ncbi:Phosphoribosyltransferase domain protein [Kalmanozyma brasiliensis GHG001]|uniref:orotate phosphoribosyltransferase n=1 Tax=Kalmanozyma brasiliensis (strain GHG001) TaxID=1365824 RepID=V5GRJ7_KALBG|nr:Phosphoribosyltransferase domain protein [Kalmanozyma brasiliensis GHG001]EST08532.1 Phosphoribosyltransferase domain protein [Kalmanozyma brasiliensis GHG001]
MARGGNRGGGRGGGRGRGRGGGGGRGRGGGGGRGGGRGAHNGGQRASYFPSDQTNARLEAYYIDQGILDPSEWATFMDYLRTPLPTTFRLTAGKETTPQLLKALQDIYIPFLSNVTFDGEKVDPPKNLPWYPDGLGWHLNTKKNVIRKSPEFKRFHQFLVHETDVGSISRQEAVSMLPPLFLDVQPHHLVLDMCAAPGSKTAQLIESLHSPFTSAPSAYNPMPTGLVIANDSDTKRAHMLVHQSQRLPSPNLLVTNLDASNYQSITVPYKAADEGAEVVQTAMKYDRILADVPCSGDGTIRKNVPIWKEWTPNNAVGLHALQLKILMRGLNQLREGGRLVYSTCSMNPIENEAVVAEALRRFEGKVRIVDCSSRLPELVRRPGLTTWRAAPGRGAHLFGKSKYAQEKAAKAAAVDAVDAAAADGEGELVDADMKDAEGEVDETADAVIEDGTNAEASTNEAAQPEIGSAEYRNRLPEIAWINDWEQLNELDADLASRTPKSLWPQGDEESLGTQHCMRLYPHLQDTGGFFVALLEKVGNPDDEGMAAGMIRAMDHLDALQPAEESITTTAKRELSPEAAADGAEPAAKKLKEDVTTEAEPIEVDASTNVKEDKHAADRARKAAQQKFVSEGHGIPGGLPYKEDPFAYIPPSNDQVQACKKFFDLKDTFPLRNLLVRNEDHQPLRSVYLTSTTARAVITSGGPGRGNHPHMNPISLRLINCGIKSLGRQDAGRDGTLECKWRIISDGLLSIRPHIEERTVLKAELKDLAFLIANHYPVLDHVPGEFGELLKGKKMGSYIVDVLPSEHEGKKLEYKLSFPIWRAVNSVNLMLDKQEKSALSFRIFDTDLSSADGGRQFSSQPSKKKKPADAEMLSDAEDAARAALTTTTAAAAAPVKVELAPYQSSYIQLALDSAILKFDGPYTLKSGRLSPYFFNAGLFNTGAKVAKVASCYAQRIIESAVEFDVLFGPAYKGIPLAAATAMALQLQHGRDVGFCFNRKEAKTHGEGGSLVGAELKGRVLILDDVITAGTAINEAMDILASQPAAVLAGVVIALDRQEKSQKDGIPGETSAITEVEKRFNTKVYSVVTLDQIIEFMKRDETTYGEKIGKMNDYRITYGTSEVAKAEAAKAAK